MVFSGRTAGGGTVTSVNINKFFISELNSFISVDNKLVHLLSKL